ARETLAPIVENVDLAPSALPHMALAEGRILGVPMRLFRVSFTGELGYEVNVPAGHARAVWEEVVKRAEASGGVPPTGPRRCMFCAPKRATSSSDRRLTARLHRPISAYPSAGRSVTSSASGRSRGPT